MRAWQSCAIALLFALLPVTAQASEEEPGKVMEAKLLEAFEAGELEGLHGVRVLLKGEVFAEATFPGEDEAWGTPLGRRDYQPEELHDLRSVTKSVVALLYGIALEEGLVPPPEAPLLDGFPDYADLAADPARRAITVADALTMRMGTEWDESLPYSDPRNSEIAMELSEDRYRFVLDRPMVETPGKTWVYNGGATAVIARLIAQGTGQPIDAYAAEKLFAPLGITDFEWVKGGDGVPSAASGLRLSLRDLAKLGQLVADDGKIGARQVVPAAWLEQALAPQTDTSEGLRYGYFWWLAAAEWQHQWVAGFGNGGQRLSINREIGLVVAVFAGNYNQLTAWQLPVKVVSDFLGPALDAHFAAGQGN